MVTLSLCVDLISLKIACDFVMNSVHYSKNTSSECGDVKILQRAVSQNIL